MHFMIQLFSTYYAANSQEAFVGATKRIDGHRGVVWESTQSKRSCEKTNDNVKVDVVFCVL